MSTEQMIYLVEAVYWHDANYVVKAFQLEPAAQAFAKECQEYADSNRENDVAGMGPAPGYEDADEFAVSEVLLVGDI